MKNKRINTPTHVRQILSEQINELRNGNNMDKSEVERLRAIGYLANIALTAIRDGELEERMKALEAKLQEEK